MQKLTIQASDVVASDKISASMSGGYYDITRIREEEGALHIRFRRGHVSHVSICRPDEKINILRAEELTPVA